MNPTTKKQKGTKANENLEGKGKCAKFSDDQIKVLVDGVVAQEKILFAKFSPLVTNGLKSQVRYDISTI